MKLEIVSKTIPRSQLWDETISKRVPIIRRESTFAINNRFQEKMKESKRDTVEGIAILWLFFIRSVLIVVLITIVILFCSLLLSPFYTFIDVCFTVYADCM